MLKTSGVDYFNNSPVDSRRKARFAMGRFLFRGLIRSSRIEGLEGRFVVISYSFSIYSLSEYARDEIYLFFLNSSIIELDI